MVVVAPIKAEKVIRVCQKHIDGLDIKSGTVQRRKPEASPIFDVVKHNGFSQAHVLIGSEAYPLDHENRPALMLLVI